VCVRRWAVRTAMADIVSPQLPQLLDLRALGAYLGRPWRTLERQLLTPPPGFPSPVRFGRLLFWPRAQIDAWLHGVPPTLKQTEESAAMPVPLAPKRARGRPRKSERARNENSE